MPRVRSSFVLETVVQEVCRPRVEESRALTLAEREGLIPGKLAVVRFAEERAAVHAAAKGQISGIHVWLCTENHVGNGKSQF